MAVLAGRMGASRRFRRLSTPAALALVLALAGAAAPVGRTGGPPTAPASASAAALTGAPAGPEPNASTTVVGQSGGPAAPPPAIRIAATGSSLGVRGVRVDIADVLLAAYRAAVRRAPVACHLPVSLLAAIGQVESGSLLGRPVDRRHRTSVLGPVLDGHGFATIADTDGGRWDGNATWDRAVGPMQFIPGTWQTFGVDGDGDGVANPQDVEDAAASTAAYLCYGGRDLSDPATLRAAILAYNHSTAYLGLVLTYQERFAGLGLDQGTTVAGLPTHLALSAVQVAPDGWAAGRVTAHATPSTKAAAGRRAGRQRTARPPATTVRAATVPVRRLPTTTATAAPSPVATPTPSTPTPTPAPTPADPSPTAGGSPSPSPEPPTPSGDPAPPSTPPSTPPSPEACPTAPASPTGPDSPTASPAPSPTSGDPADPTPSTDPTDPADPDVTCAPCPDGTDPTPEAPCLPPEVPATSPEPSPSASGTATPEASPSSVR